MRKAVKTIAVLSMVSCLFTGLNVCAADMAEGVTIAQGEQEAVLEGNKADYIRWDFLQFLKKENPNNTHLQKMKLADMEIYQYCGSYGGNEVVVMSTNMWAGSTDIVNVKIGDQVFRFGSSALADSFYLHKDHSFIPVAEAYEQKLLSDADLAKIAELYDKEIKVSEEVVLPFEDVNESDWYFDYVKMCYINGVMTGKNTTEFAPGETLARAQFAVILHRMNKEPEVEFTNKFPDIAEGQWYTEAVLWANEMGVVTGYTDTKMFGPADKITREQMAVMMYRYALTKKTVTTEGTELDKFVDADHVNAFAKKAMQWAVANGIITGKDNGTKLDPQGNATRAECATIIIRFNDKFEK